MSDTKGFTYGEPNAYGGQYNQPPPAYEDPNSGYAPPLNTGYAPPPNSGYAPPPNTGYAKPPNSGFAQQGRYWHIQLKTKIFVRSIGP